MRKVTKTLLFRWIFVGFAPFIQAENFPHPLSRQRIIVIILCLDSGCEKISAWINGAKPMENHRKSNVLNTSSYQCDNDNLLTKHTLLYHIALTTLNENSFQVATCVPSETTKVRKRVDSASYSQEGMRMSDENQVGIS